MSREIRRIGHRLPDRVPRTLISPQYTYPFLYHWLLSFVSDRHLGRAERLTGPLADTVHVALAFWFADAIFAYFVTSAEARSGLAFATAGLTAISPAFLAVGVGPRAYSGSPRPIAQLLFLVFIGACTLAIFGEGPGWLTIAALAAAAIVVTSKFGNQVLAFTSLGMLLLGHPELIISALIGLAIAAALSRGRALRVLYGQIAHSAFYFKHLQRPFLYPERRTVRNYLGAAFVALRTCVRTPLRCAEWALAERFLPHRLVINFPQIVVFAALVASSATARETAASPEFLVLVEIVAVSLVAGLVTGMKPLLFLGEPERYLEHTVMLQLLVIVWLANVAGQQWILWLLAGYSLVVYVLSVRVYVRTYRPWAALKMHLPKVVQRIDREGAKVLPVGGIFWAALYFSRFLELYIHGANFDSKRMDVDRWRALFGRFPLPGVRIAEVASLVPLDYVIGTAADIERYERAVGDDALTRGVYLRVAESAGFVAYAISSNPAQGREPPVRHG
jgi:hypothetical protein